MRRTSPLVATLMVGALFSTGMLVGSIVGQWAVERATRPYAGLERFARLASAIERDHIEPLERSRLVDAAVEGMVGELDPHSRWMSAEEVKDLRDDAEGHVMGFGIEVRPSDEGVVVTDVLPDSPAALRGLQSGDRIVSIDGIPLSGLSLRQVERKLDAENRETAAFQILRDGEERPLDLAAERAAIPIAAVESKRMGDIVYARIIDFQRGAAAELGHALEQHLANLPSDTRILLDLRDNTGGLLSEAVAVVDLFVDRGSIVGVRSRDLFEDHRATPGGLGPEPRLVVLVDGLSASASEIVAGSLQQTGRGLLAGRETYGKGSVQKLYTHGDGSALKLTVARYHLPDGSPILAGKGLAPDIELPLVDVDHPRDALINALNNMDIPERDRLLYLASKLEERRARIQRRDWVPLERRAEEDPDVASLLARW